MIKPNTIHLGDCLEVMQDIESKSIDMILCDLPYGTTACSWDVVIPFKPLWDQYERIIKDNGAIVLFGSQPFTSKLIMSNLKLFKYCWVWEKKLAGNGILAKHQPLKIHEDVIIFNSKRYYPQKIRGKARIKGGIKDKHGTFNGAESKKEWNDMYYPVSIIEFSGAGMRTNREHPTQKPVKLFQYLILTYTNKKDLVLDNCLGSGTTAIACIKTGRQYIGIEKEPKYFKIAQERIKLELSQPMLEF